MIVNSLNRSASLPNSPTLRDQCRPANALGSARVGASIVTRLPVRSDRGQGRPASRRSCAATSNRDGWIRQIAGASFGLLAVEPAVGELASLNELISAGRLRDARILLERLAPLIPPERYARFSRVLARPKVKPFHGKIPTGRANLKWLREKASDYRGRWVALCDGALVADAAELAECLQQVRVRALCNAPLVHYVS